MDEKLDIIAIGETLVELSSIGSFHDTESFSKYYGSDNLATLIAAQRLGAKTGYLTKIGNDAFEKFLIDSLHAENINTDCLSTTPEKNGVYIIGNIHNGEKEFSYYRNKTAATKLSIDDVCEDYIKNTKFLYTTGVTQSLSLSAKEAVKEAFYLAKKNGVTTAYDPNYTSELMTKIDVKEAVDEVIENVDIIFLSLKQEAEAVYDITSVDKIIKYFWDLGVTTVVIKSHSEKGYYTGYNGEILFYPYYTKQEEVIDTTGAGDAFNGAFLYALSIGKSPFEATKLAAIVGGLQAKSVGAVKSIPYKDTISKILEAGCD